MALTKQGKTTNMSVGASYSAPQWYFTLNHTQATGTDGLLVVVVATSSSLTLTNPTYNGVAMTQAGTWYSAPGSSQYAVFYKAGPATGANAFRIDSNNNGTAAIYCQSFTGADTTVQILNSAAANTPHSQNITIGANSMIMGLSASLYTYDTNAITIDGTGFGFASCDMNGSVSTAQICAHTRDARLTSGTKTVTTDTIADAFQATNLRLEIKELVSTIAPTVTTNTSITSITCSTAVSGGDVTSDGGATVTARGVCWNTSTNPTTSNSKTTDGTGTGAFTSNITGLTTGTTYYVRAYATNSVGTSYGSNVTFTSDRRIMICS